MTSLAKRIHIKNQGLGTFVKIYDLKENQKYEIRGMIKADKAKYGPTVILKVKDPATGEMYRAFVPSLYREDFIEAAETFKADVKEKVYIIISEKFGKTIRLEIVEK